MTPTTFQDILMNIKDTSHLILLDIRKTDHLIYINFQTQTYYYSCIEWKGTFKGLTTHNPISLGLIFKQNFNSEA